MKHSKTSLAITVLLCATVSSTVVGCGSGAPSGVVQASATQVDSAVKMREFFTKSSGNFDALSAEDKAAYDKLAGGEAAGQAQWKVMSAHPVTASAPGNGDPRTGQ